MKKEIHKTELVKLRKYLDSDPDVIGGGHNMGKVKTEMIKLKFGKIPRIRIPPYEEELKNPVYICEQYYGVLDQFFPVEVRISKRSAQSWRRKNLNGRRLRVVEFIGRRLK